MPQLTLYYEPMCSYCQKVMDFLNRHEIKIEMKSTHNELSRLELMSIGGKTQVPCLVIDDRALYESDAIIEWFKKNL